MLRGGWAGRGLDDDDTDQLSRQTLTLALSTMSLVLPESHQQFQVPIVAFFFTRTLANYNAAHLAFA